jgi:hypothetical protein
MEKSVEDSITYTLDGLADALGFRQTRTLERLLIEIECPIRNFGRKKLVSGKQFRLAIERTSCSPTSGAGRSSVAKGQRYIRSVTS